MGWIDGIAGHRFEHDGQQFLISAVRTGEGWALITNRLTASGATFEIGHRDYLSPSGSESELLAKIERLQRRIESGDAPDEEPSAHEN